MKHAKYFNAKIKTKNVQREAISFTDFLVSYCGAMCEYMLLHYFRQPLYTTWRSQYWFKKVYWHLEYLTRPRTVNDDVIAWRCHEKAPKILAFRFFKDCTSSPIQLNGIETLFRA